MINLTNKFFDNNPLYKQTDKNINCLYCKNKTEHKKNELNPDSIIYICLNCNKQFFYNRDINRLVEERKN